MVIGRIAGNKGAVSWLDAQHGTCQEVLPHHQQQQRSSLAATDAGWGRPGRAPRTWLSVFLKLLSSAKALLMLASYLSRMASSTDTYSTGSFVCSQHASHNNNGQSVNEEGAVDADG
eukprot:GHRQ01022603.1.p2 GENE.GHRQ01022603.1~~GHRQ01022603.1.p2  ORF type:complete len:117 (+),score=21.98 GHRQ01022603.1:567-917(+)